MARLGLEKDQWVDLISHFESETRRAERFKVVPYEIPLRLRRRLLPGDQRARADPQHGRRQQSAGFQIADHFDRAKPCSCRRLACARAADPGMKDRADADSALECVRTQELMKQAIHLFRRGRIRSYAGVPHGVELKAEERFYAHVHLLGADAPVRRFLPDLIELLRQGRIKARKSFSI